MKRILFPTDFSESANNALAYAGKFASDNTAELVLYNASKLLETLSAEDAHEKLNTVAREVRESFNISCSTVLEPGGISLGNLIGREATEYDLVIMGTNGADDLIQYLNGSNAFNAILKSNVPILVIPVEFREEKVSTVIYAFDYYKEQKLPVKQLLPWLKAIGNQHVTVLQVLDQDSTGSSSKEFVKAPFERSAENAPVEFKLETIRSDAGLALGINRYMLNIDAGVLCLCTQKRGLIENFFHKSVIKDITAIASYPLFVFHE